MMPDYDDDECPYCGGEGVIDLARLDANDLQLMAKTMIKAHERAGNQ